MAEHILVGISSAPSNARIIHTAATMAEAFGGSFTALFVRTPAMDAMSDPDKARLRSNLTLAQKLGATIETVFGDDVPYQIAEYARLSGVTKIVVGRSAISKRKLFGKPTLTEKLTQIAPNIDIHIIPDASVDAPYHQKTLKRKLQLRTVARDWAVSMGLVLLATVVARLFSGLGFSEANILTLYLLAVLINAMLTSSRSGHVLCAVGSVAVFNFLFSRRLGFPAGYADGMLLSLLIMLVAALTVGAMADRLKVQTRQSTRAAYRTNLLLETNQLLQKAQTDEAIFRVAHTQVSKLLGRPVQVYPDPAAERVPQRQYFPIKVQDRSYGTVVLEGEEPLEAFENSVLLSVLGECALALENSRNEREKEAAKLQAENEKIRANLLRAISHDLRTPLTAISGNAAILLADDAVLDSASKRRMYADIYDDSAWLHKLVENLLAVTKLQEGHMDLKFQPHVIEEIVSEALQHINRKKTEHTITVSHADELLLVRCDARMIVQVIINLVDNAIKYTQPGSCIHISTAAEDGSAVFRVADDGPGIADREKEAVFQMFYTGANSVADSCRSLGLGLSLCKSIVTVHGGRICVGDNVPNGAVFTFTIPAGEVIVHE